ncbi:type II toxin-antitoxin system MqsA family antitoxin [Microvirga sp. 3-52]|uniref:type II TA system antitoxin MqsA family protein n=1 Tax=Microvirga sp. 3-52 TaxID=2792425 RepID=UPI001AC07312|nr:type II TA system antitoxin MqsA family protein [Microvirga sp. 3-52]MBO1905340.1 type II toxin-antitoxin system MqsA family antitoxin [Microvirga sp. 3-52]MBS7452571.1 type II toxin-antitoxin system MqsA family antitoxin [Microvirga sp. 3-52]
MTLDRCIACEEVAVEERIEPYVVEHDGKSATIQDGRMVCTACGNVSYRGSQISEHELAVAAAIRQMDGLLSADELLRIRTKYSLKQTDMEQMLSTGPKTWTRWERGKVPQNKPADKLIRLLAEDPELTRQLMRQAGVINEEAEAAIERFEQDAKRLMRTMVMSKVGTAPSAEMQRFAERVAEEAFETVRDARRQVVARGQAA